MAAEFATKLERLRAFMGLQGLGALVLGRQENVTWLTGARGHINLATEVSCAWIVVTEGEVRVVTNAIEAPRFRQEELGALPLEVVEFLWYDEAVRTSLINTLAAGKPMGADLPLPGAVNVAGALAPLRWAVLPEEQERARKAGRAAAEVLEDTCRWIHPGQTEFEIAGALAQRIMALGMDPVVNLIATDERVFAYRHPLPTGKRLEKYAMLVICARSRGLIVSATRLVHFGPVPTGLARRMEACARVDAIAIAATRPGTPIPAIWEKITAAYAEAGYPGEWEKHHQGGLSGYLSREYRAMPGSTHVVAAGQIFAWNPSIAGVKSEDTILTTDAGVEILTATGSWPTIPVAVGGQTLQRPAILER